MPINESDPLGIGGGIDVSDPLGIAGPIQKMKPTGPSIGPWSPTIGQRLEMASPSLFGSEIQPATGMPEGLVPRGLNAVQSLMFHAPFAQQTEFDPTQPNLMPGTPPQGFGAFVNPFLQQVNLQNVLLAKALPELFAAKMAGPVVNATKAGVSALFGAQGAEQAGQAFGKASVEGVPRLPLSPGDPEAIITNPLLHKAPEYGGTTPQWENLANEILGLAQVTGAAVGPHVFGRETSQGSYTPMQGPPIIEVPPERQLQAPRFQRGKAPYQSPFSPEMAQGSLAFPFERPDAPVGPPKNFTLPIIGERPLTIEQPIIRPGEVNPQDPLQIEKGIGFAGEPKQGGQISFQGQGIPSAMQSRVIPKGEQSEQAALMQGGFVPRVEKTKLQSGINPDDLLPAINFAGKLLIGRQGDTHADILERNGIDPRAVAHPDPARGFVNGKTGEFLSRLEAQKQSGIVGTAKAGGLDSMDLPGAAKTKVMRDSGFSDSEIRETLGSKLYSGLGFGEYEKHLSKETAKEFRGVMDKLYKSYPSFPSQVEAESSFERVSPFDNKLHTEIEQELSGTGARLHMDFPKLMELAINNHDSIRKQLETGTGELGKFVNEVALKHGFGDKAWPKLSQWLVSHEGDFKRLSRIREALSRMVSRGEDSRLYSGLNFNKILPGGKDDPMFPILTRIQDAGYETLYSEHGMGEGDSTPYVVFKRTTANKDARIKEAAKVVGAEVEERPKRIGVYLKESDKVEDIKKDWESFTKHLGEGMKLYSGLPIFDEKLWRSKDKVEKEQEESVKLGLGKQPITSLPLDPDPESVNKTTTKLNSGLIPALTGYGVDRPLNEVIEAFAAKQAGWSAPRHIAANEELGNALVRVAASDIASVMESKASSPAVAASYKQNTFKLLYDAYINSGFGQAVVKGVPAPVMGGKPMELVHINKKPLWIRSDLEPEFSQALQTDSRVRKAGAALLMDLATELQVIGLTDFTFHGANMFGSIAYDLGAKTTEGDLVRGTVPGARHIDAIMRIGHEMHRVILDDPAVRRELADIAKIGALRAEEQGQSLISRTPVVGKYIDMGRWIQLFDKAGRLARNKMFDNLVDRKLIKDTELDRREFINKMGQYNARLMSKFQDFQRQYVSQFVVAGRTFNRNAFQRVFMSNQARALNPAAYAKMKALNAASLFSALLVTPVVFNMWTTGKPFGRKGTDIGSVDTGKDDENGRPIQIDILQTTLLRRGFRNLGLQALQKDVRAGKDFGTTATDMGRDIANGLIHPWAGPPIRAGWTTITGKSVGFGGFPLSKDTESLTDNFLAGLSQVNPMAAAAYDKSVKGDKADGYFQRTAAAVGLKKGPFPTHEDDLEKETGKKPSEMSLGERVQAEKSHKEKAEKLSPETKAKAAEKSIENITKRGEELSKQMTKADRQWMESRGLNVPGFDNKIHAGKILVYLTKDEMERLSKYTLEAYNEAITEVRQKYPQLSDNSKDLYFNARMSAARGKARTRIIQELNSLNESNQKTKKRFTVFDNE